jgi:hypothetical protein
LHYEKQGPGRIEYRLTPSVKKADFGDKGAAFTFENKMMQKPN